MNKPAKIPQNISQHNLSQCTLILTTDHVYSIKKFSNKTEYKSSQAFVIILCVQIIRITLKRQ